MLWSCHVAGISYKFIVIFLSLTHFLVTKDDDAYKNGIGICVVAADAAALSNSHSMSPYKHFIYMKYVRMNLLFIYTPFSLVRAPSQRSTGNT
jgi:hypothetical protein